MKIFVAELVNEYLHVTNQRFFKADTQEDAYTQLRIELSLEFLARDVDEYDISEVYEEDTRTIQKAKNYFKHYEILSI